MKDHYMVKFDLHGRTRYGVCQAYTDEAKAAAKRGECFIEDAVTTETFSIKESLLTDIDILEDAEYTRYVEAAEKAAEKVAAKVQGVKTGAMFSIGVADGSATYVVMETVGKKCRLEWRGFCLDRYKDHHFGWGGWFPKSEVEAYVAWESARRKVFA